MSEINHTISKIEKQFYPINKSIFTLKEKGSLDVKKINNDKPSVSIITCTNRPNYMDNVFENFETQTYEKKELIIILNNNKMNIKKWKEKAEKYNNVRVFQLDENVTLGECLNFGIEKANFGIIAKFDDDDYYASQYLQNSIMAFNYTDADVVGKATTYVYFEESKILAIRNYKRENRYVYRIEGPTMLIKKEVFNKIKFRKISLGEDVKFCKDCIKNGFKIYAHNRYDYVYIRHGRKSSHTWNISDNYFLKLCKVIGKIDDYKSYVTL